MKCNPTSSLLLQLKECLVKELQREAAVAGGAGCGVPLVCVLYVQDAKAHQLKELQCEAAVLDVYTGLYKMTELMQDSRAEVYVGTVGEPQASTPLAPFCARVCQWSSRAIVASRLLEVCLMAHSCRTTSGLAASGALTARWGMATGGFQRAEGLPAAPASHALQLLPCAPGGPIHRSSLLKGLWHAVCSLLHAAVMPCWLALPSMAS